MMLNVRLRALGAMLLLAFAPAHAQVGKYPVLAPFAHMRGECRFGSPNAAMARLGASRVAVFLPVDSARRVSVSFDTQGRVRMFSAYYQKQVRKARGESEVVVALFTPDGKLMRGSRAYRVNKSPASTNENREVLLSDKDTKAVIALALAVGARCISLPVK